MNSNSMLEEAEKKGIKYFLSLVEDLEQQEDLMTKSSNKTVGSCGFKIHELCVIRSFGEDKPSFGIILDEVESCKAIYDEECLSEEDKEELLQQKEFTNSLLNERSIFNGDETVMSCMRDPVIEKEKEELAYLNEQEKIVGQTLRAITEGEDQNSILMKDVEIASQNDWLGDKEEENNEDKGEVYMSQAKG
jgi:hypothetical protein